MKRIAIVLAAAAALTAGTSHAQTPVREPLRSAQPSLRISEPRSPAPVIPMAQARPSTVAPHRIENTPVEPQIETSVGELSPTPEMWFYQQELRRQADPKVAVRAAAESRAKQRHNRIESRRWFGLSNARPMHSVTPFTNDSSPHWVSNTPGAPYEWSGFSYTPMFYRVSNSQAFTGLW